MPKEPKSRQEKKEHEYTKDHFTFSESPHGFRKTWKRKKTLINREFRRKSDELLAQTKPELSADSVELVADDITATYLEKSVLRKRLNKSSTVPLGEKIKIKLESATRLLDEELLRNANSTSSWQRRLLFSLPLKANN